MKKICMRILPFALLGIFFIISCSKSNDTKVSSTSTSSGTTTSATSGTTTSATSGTSTSATSGNTTSSTGTTTSTTSGNTTSTTSGNTTSTTSTTSGSTGSTTSGNSNFLIVDGVNMKATSVGSTILQGNLQLEFKTSAAEGCQTFFSGSNPANGNYPSNWTTVLTGSQSKSVFLASGTAYLSAAGTNFTLTNLGGGKFRVSFNNVVFNELNSNGGMGSGLKIISGNYGN